MTAIPVTFGRLAIVAMAVLVGVAMLIGIFDIAASVADNRLGIISGRAIEAVRTSPEAEGSVAEIVARNRPASRWTAFHSDDDSLFSVRVVNGIDGEDPRHSLEWCVLFGVDWSPLPRLVVRDLAPGNLRGQAIAPEIAKRYEPLQYDGNFYCSGVRSRRRADGR